ncbi:hypothetical protein [Flexithrix dorotheae]|uniref:hypothetical protein n=1 Tax=Flexithrix dorotheae TaxID=70993 RepID=UPI0012FAFCE2|nr:hypothetical protein [Flexithrix dorotheae]
MSSLLFIVCLLVGAFTFSTLLYIYFAYTAQPHPDEEILFQSIKNKNLSLESGSVNIDSVSIEERVA